MGTALVTGATSGIGREFCWQLSNAGNDLVMVARNRGRLDALATNIRRVNGVNVEVLVADLAEPDDLAQVCRRLAVRPVEAPDSEELPSSVDLLVNNAGFGFDSSFLDDDFDKQLYGLDVMVRAVMATCYYGGRQMRSAGRGGIINVSSVAADTGMGPYSAHKAWVRTFSEGLYEELRGSGVNVTVVMPGLTHTEFHDRSGGKNYYGQAMEALWMTPHQVVKATLEALERKQPLVTPSLRYKASYQATRIAPRFLVRAIVSKLPHA